MVKPRTEGGTNATINGDDLVASTEMCQYCFDILLKKLLPRSPPTLPSSSSGGVGRGVGISASRSSSGSPSHKRRWKKKNNIDPQQQHQHQEDQKDGKDGVDEGENDDDKLERRKVPLSTEVHTSFIPPAVECPLFVTWEKRRYDYKKIGAVSMTSEITTPASSNITDDDGNSSANNNNNNNNSTTPDDNHNNSESITAIDDSEYDLRGCIGTLAPRPLHHALSEFALHSALRDRRFDPIAFEELPLLRVGVSLLVKYEECENCHDWEVGVHGIIIRFECNRGGREYSATYLPEVASEQNWSQEEAVISLVRKAGYRGSIHEELLERIECTRYQSSKHRLTYQNYVLSKYKGEDPLQFVDLMASAAVDEAMRQRVKASKPCVNL